MLSKYHVMSRTRCQLRTSQQAHLRTFRLLFFPLFRNKINEYELGEYFTMDHDGYFTVDEVTN